jgi:hypothetical protein
MFFINAKEQATPLTTLPLYVGLSVNVKDTDVFTSGKPWRSLQSSGMKQERLAFSAI